MRWPEGLDPLHRNSPCLQGDEEILEPTETCRFQNVGHHGVSENSVPLNIMVNDDYPY